MRTTQANRPRGVKKWFALLPLLVLALMGAGTPAARAAAANDAFASAIPIIGPSGVQTGTTLGASREAGEPLHFVGATGNSVWYQWTATLNGYITFDTLGSADNTALAVYTGDTVTHLNLVGRNNLGATNLVGQTGSQVTFLATAGNVYDIAVDSMQGGGGFQLNWWAAVGGNLQWASELNNGINPVMLAASSNEVSKVITLARRAGETGTILFDINMTNLWYTFTFSTNYSGTNIFLSNHSNNLFTNLFYTNVTSSNVLQSYVNGQLTSYSCTAQGAQITTNLSGIGTSTNGLPNPTNPIAPIFCMNMSITFDDGTNMIAMTNYFCTNVTTTVMVPTAVPGVDYVPLSGIYTMRDYQMALDIPVTIPNSPTPPGLSYNRLFVAIVSNARLDPLESTDLRPPSTAPNTDTLYVNLCDLSIDPVSPCLPTAAVMNFLMSVIKVDEYALRTAPLPNDSYAVQRTGVLTNANTVNYTEWPDGQQIHREFPLQPASDYSIPGTDYMPVNGTLAWPAVPTGKNANQSVPLTIPQVGGVSFNKDIYLSLNLNPPANADVVTPHLGYLPNQTVTLIGGDAQAAGALDNTFNLDSDLSTSPPNNLHPGANDVVYGLVSQPDGKTVVVGNFTAYNTTLRNHIARMNTDGQLDGGFLAYPNSGANDVVTAVALQGDGKLIIAGRFTSFNGINRHGIARLNTDGSLDTTFDTGLGMNDAVWCLALQQDGRVVVGGDFTVVNNTNAVRVARLNTDGSLDTTFSAGDGPDSTVNAIAIQLTGKIDIGGDFSNVNDTNRNYIAQLNSDGSLDTTFNGAGADGTVYALTIQPGGSVLAGGAFNHLNLAARKSIGRLNQDGSLDPTFDPGSGADDTVYSIAVQPDAKLLVGGQFTLMNGTRRVGVTRLFPYGAVDTSFLDTAYNQFAGIPVPYYNPDITPRNFVFALSVQPDGNIMIGGGFDTVGAGAYTFHAGLRDEIRPRSNVARLLGGSTPGPGNVALAFGNYTVDENGSQLYVTMTRTNGSLGIVGANLVVGALPPGPGAAVEGLGSDYYFNDAAYGKPYWDTRWSLPGIIKADGYTGPNTTFGGTDASANSYINVNDNTIVDGNRDFAVSLNTPNSDFFVLGGEHIPLGTALGAVVSADTTIVDNDSTPGVLGFSITNYTVSEAGGSALITVTRTNGSSGQVTVHYQTIDGTAIAGASADYIGTNGTLTFAPGVLSRSFSVGIVNNTIAQPDRTLGLRLSNLTGGATGGQTNATLTIINDNFAAGHLNFSLTNFVAHETAGTVTVTVTRTGGTVNNVSVYAGTSDGTAINGVNYTGTTNLLSWNNGDATPRTFTIPLIHDGLVTPNLTVNLKLFSAVVNGGTNSAALGISNAVVTILNDDAFGNPAFSTAAYTVNENGGSALITVIRQAGSAQTMTVNYATSDLTAHAGTDYTAASGTLTFAPGVFTRTFSVPIHDDLIQNGNRTFALTLSSPTPGGQASLGNPASANVTIIDNETYNEPSGNLDATYDPGAVFFNNNVNGLALQTDGRVVAGGDFTGVNNVARNHIARLNTDGYARHKLFDDHRRRQQHDPHRDLPDGRTHRGGRLVHHL